MGRTEFGEEVFRKLIRQLVAKGQYPDHTSVRNAMGRMNSVPQLRSGLDVSQTQWRIEEVEKAGYDWLASRKVHRLVRKGH